MVRHCFTVFIVALVLFGGNVLASQDARTYQQTRELLTSLKSVSDNRDVLATLFESGDVRIDDLIKALDDPDREISLRAQRVIRYLGNQSGMKALDDWYSGKTEILRSGPIPLPLTERDYKWIENQPADENFEYIYALALDGSERARRALDEMMKSELPVGSATRAALTRVKASQPRKLISGRTDLARLVLQNAFFIAPRTKRYASAKLIALNGAKNKALVEVYLSPGPLATERYHVVISKRGTRWQFFSITQLSVS